MSVAGSDTDHRIGGVKWGFSRRFNLHFHIRHERPASLAFDVGTEDKGDTHRDLIMLRRSARHGVNVPTNIFVLEITRLFASEVIVNTDVVAIKRSLHDRNLIKNSPWRKPRRGSA